MKFCNFLLRVGGIREASLEDFRQVLSKGNRTYKPERQKYLYSIDMEIIADRYFWMSCDYDDAVRFRDYVINKETGEKEPSSSLLAMIVIRICCILMILIGANFCNNTSAKHCKRTFKSTTFIHP